ncbi:hypothetical protein [Telluribacter sp.]|uniref:hypothetical protein n=1 Tax=Telluribacter sp. TaxID=1978767 RepID=UPI002E0D74F9|nr:hypothetical protein [Telluribacter sp.]
MKSVRLLAFLFFASCGAALAQSSQNETVTLNLTDVFDVQLEAVGNGNVFTFNDPGTYETGTVNSGATRLKVRSNRDWKIMVSTATDYFQKGGVDSGMPSGILAAKPSSGSTFLPLSLSPAQLTTGGRGDATGNNTFTVDYEAKPGFAYEGGMYTIVVQYTVSQQ